MLRITVPADDYYDETTETFIEVKEQTLTLEHSLVSVSKWESKWCKPFFDNRPKTYEENIDYIRCMTITQNVNPLVYLGINKSLMATIANYTNAPMTATTIRENKSGGNSKKIITSERIYSWMFSLGIPMECQKWHINRLLMLIRVCNIENQPPKKMSAKETLRRYRSLNADRRKKLNTRG